MRQLLLALAILASLPANAEIEKFADPCEAGICMYWWPKLPEVKGWHQEPRPSRHYGANTLAPDGSTFVDAETVMYAKAFYKPRIPEIKSLAQLITDDQAESKSKVPGVVIAETKAVVTGDGRELKSFTYAPTTQGNWERVTYGEEGDFFLIFTVSSRSKKGYEQAMPAYEAMVRGYKEKF